MGNTGGCCLCPHVCLTLDCVNGATRRDAPASLPPGGWPSHPAWRTPSSRIHAADLPLCPACCLQARARWRQARCGGSAAWAAAWQSSWRCSSSGGAAPALVLPLRQHRGLSSTAWVAHLFHALGRIARACKFGICCWAGVSAAGAGACSDVGSPGECTSGVVEGRGVGGVKGQSGVGLVGSVCSCRPSVTPRRAKVVTLQYEKAGWRGERGWRGRHCDPRECLGGRKMGREMGPHPGRGGVWHVEGGGVAAAVLVGRAGWRRRREVKAG